MYEWPRRIIPSNTSLETSRDEAHGASGEKDVEIERAVAAADAEQQIAKAALEDALRCRTL